MKQARRTQASGQQPYFAMEFIRGVPLRDYAEATGSVRASGSNSWRRSATRSSMRTSAASSTAI